MRRALLIGNNNYNGQLGNLKNPVNDVKLMREILKYKGFFVKIGLNLIDSDMKNIIDLFIKSVQEGDDVLIFFSGHGFEDRDTNYLLPIDTMDNFDKEGYLTVEKIKNKLSKVNEFGVKIIIIDACRNNPVLVESPMRTGSILDGSHNTLIAFSTSKGNVAKDGKGMSSYYTKSLVKNIKNYNLTINEVFSRTREDVINYSDFSQIPWEYSSLQEINNFSFDNIKVPNKLIRIAKSQFSDALAINSDEFGFYIGGQGNFIEVFDKTRESCEKINFNMVDERIDIECISKNENHMIVLMERGEVVIFELKKMKKKKPFRIERIKFEGYFFTTTINEEDVFFIAGMSCKIIGFDLVEHSRLDIDIEREVILKIYESMEYVESIRDKITIVAMSFSRKNKNILAYGGSHGIFCIKDIKENKYLFINKRTDEFSYTYCIDFSSDGNYIVTSHEGGKVLLWSAKNFSLINKIERNKYINKTHFFENINDNSDNNILKVVFSPNSDYIVFSTSESIVAFYDVKYMEKIDEIDLNIEQFKINSLALNNTGENLLISMNKRHYLFKI